MHQKPLIDKSLSWIMQDLRAMTDAAGNRPVIVINPRLKVGLQCCSLSILVIHYDGYVSISIKDMCIAPKVVTNTPFELFMIRIYKLQVVSCK